MSEPKWTPGPWRKRNYGSLGNAIEGFSGRKSHPGHDGYRIVATYQDACKGSHYDEEEANRAANGNLIAAAPDLYEALAGLLEMPDYHPMLDRAEKTERSRAYEAAKAALAKARGETP